MNHLVEFTPNKDRPVESIVTWLRDRFGREGQEYILDLFIEDRNTLYPQYILRVWFKDFEESVAFKVVWS